MNTGKRIVKNISVLVIARILCLVFGFYYTMYVARYLGAEAFGILSFALAFTAFLGVLTDVGLQQLIIREVAKERALLHKYLVNITVLKILLCIIFFLVIELIIYLSDYPGQTIKVIHLVAISVAINAFTLMLYGAFFAYERMEFAAIGRTVNSVLLLLLALYAINQNLGVVGFASIYCVVNIILLVYAIGILFWKLTISKSDIDLVFLKMALKQAWPFGLIALFGAIRFSIDSIMLSYFIGNEAVGLYNAAKRLIMLLQFIPIAYFSAVFPVMSRFYVTSKESMKLLHEKSLKYFFIFSVPIGIGTTLLADKIISLIYGADYLLSVPVLQVLIWSLVIGFPTASFSVLFNSMNRQKMVAWVTGSCSVLFLLFNLILIPKYGIIGAGIAHVVSNVAAFILFAAIWFVKVGYDIPEKHANKISAVSLVKTIYRIMLSSLMMFAFIQYAANSLNLFTLIPLSGVLYFSVLLIVKGIDKEDLLLFRSIFLERNPDNKDAGIK